MAVGEGFPTPNIPGAKVLVVSAPYYRAITDAMKHGVERVATEAGATLEHIEVPGAFELPAAILNASFSDRYDGYIALGCVVRGATSHYDYVCGESARGLMDLTLQGLAIGYGVLTVENLQQAEERASVTGRDKGREVANACFSIIALKRKYGGQER